MLTPLLLTLLLWQSPLGPSPAPAPHPLPFQVLPHPTEAGLHLLQWPDGRHATVQLLPDAIVHHPDPSALRADGLELRPLMPAADLYLVRDPNPHITGLELSQRYADRYAIFPDIGLRHRLLAPPAPFPPATSPNDPRYAEQWYLRTIDIESAWALTHGDPETTIAIVDNGCDLEHPDLIDAYLEGADLLDESGDGSYQPNRPNNEHGTACAGLAAATTDNNLGIAGVCPQCTLRCLRLLPDSSGALVPLSADVAAFNTQLEWGVAVSSNSWGFTDHFPVPWPLQRAIESLIQNGRQGLGTAVIFAVGNDAREIFEDELYGIEGLISVGAINAFDELASFSNHGTMVDLVAPAGTFTTDISGPDGADEGDYTRLFGGTSSAAPIVSGVAALMLSLAPETDALSLERILLESARPAPFAAPDAEGHDPHYGFGIVDPAASLRALLPPDEEEPGPGDETPTENPEEDPAPSDDQGSLTEPNPEPPPGADSGCHHAPLSPLLLSGLLLLGRRRR